MSRTITLLDRHFDALLGALDDAYWYRLGLAQSIDAPDLDPDDREALVRLTELHNAIRHGTRRHPEVNLRKPAERRRHYRTVRVGETIHAQGVPFVVTHAPVRAHRGNNRHVWWFVGRYIGEYLGVTSPLYPFVTDAGHDWTFQRAEAYAWLQTIDDGKTWHQA